MNTFAAGTVNFVGRLCLTSIFLSSVFMQKIPKFGSTVDTMQQEGVPLPNLMLVGAIVFLLAGGFMVLLGYKARWGALLLLIFLILAAYFFHDFWTMSDPQERMNQMQHFMKNFALMGAMLILIACGSGTGSLDHFLARRKSPVRVE